jgi:CO dehydrogenase maturation factor
MRCGKHRVLAIDADPAVGLATSLGLGVRKTVDDIRHDLIREITSDGSVDPRELLHRIDYDILDALTEHRNLAFLAIGRPERQGCYCQVNELLKEIIDGLAKQFDYVIVDGEAGIEQVNRRVLTRVTHLMLVSDASLKGLNVCQAISEVAASTIAFQTSGLLINRLRDQDQPILNSVPSGMNLIGTIGESDLIRRYDRDGTSFLHLSDCDALASLGRCLARMGLVDEMVSPIS